MPSPNPVICQLTSVHVPHDTRICHKECKSLKSAGFDLVLVAPGPHESVDVVKVIGPDRARSRAVRMLQSLFYYPYYAARTGATVIHFHDPELLPGAVALRLLGRKVVYDVHEDVPDDIRDKVWIASFLRAPLAAAVDAIERLGARCMTAIVAATPKIAARFPERKTTLVQNFPLLSEMEGVTGSALPYHERPFDFTYIGSITEHRGARQMVQAMAILGPTIQTRFRFGGDIWPDELQNEMMADPGWKYVDYLGWCDRKSVVQVLGSVRAGLVLLHPTRNHLDALPNKLFEYMGAGLPVIASDFPILRNIVETTQCGLLVNPLDPAAIARAMRWILEHPQEALEMGLRGREAIRVKYNWDIEKEALLELYGRLLPGQRSAREASPVV